MSAVEIKKEILEKDWSLLLSESSTHSSQLRSCVLHCIATSECSWPKIWDHALDYGAHGTDCTQAMVES